MENMDMEMRWMERMELRHNKIRVPHEKYKMIFDELIKPTEFIEEKDMKL